jgi:long-subunit fatty acid transport protein
MKFKFLSILAIIALSSNAFAQGEMDAYKLSRNSLTGTARSVSMGGAFGALGGDISSISINPAGIGVYKTSEVVATMNFQNTKTTTQMNNMSGPKTSQDKFKFTFDNIGFVGTVPTNNSDIVPLINFGFSYNRVMSFDRKYKLQGDNLNNSIAGYMAHRANNMSPLVTDPDNKFLVDGDGKNNEGRYAFDDYDWMALLGYNSYMIDYNNGRYYAGGAFNSGGIYNELNVIEKGAIDRYDFNVGTTFADIVSFGLTVSVTDLNYRIYSDYSEVLNSAGNGFVMDNWLHTEGTGWQIKTGLIFKPIHELRIGVAYHSPTWYNMTDYFGAGIDYNVEGLLDPPPGPNDVPAKDNIYSGDYGPFDYKFRSPDKFIASLAGVIGQIAIISADYEYTNYSGSMKLFDRNGDDLSHNPNKSIDTHYKGASSVRLGGELRVTPQFSLRAGYAWMQSPVDAKVKDNPTTEEIITVGSDAHYILDGDTHHITWGAGYRFTKNFYTDIAFVVKNRKSDLYTFYGSDKAEIKDQVFQGLLTFGVRF